MWRNVLLFIRQKTREKLDNKRFDPLQRAIIVGLSDFLRRLTKTTVKQ